MTAAGLDPENPGRHRNFRSRLTILKFRMAYGGPSHVNFCSFYNVVMSRLDQIADLEKRFLLPTYNRYPVAFERGKGVFLLRFRRQEVSRLRGRDLA